MSLTKMAWEERYSDGSGVEFAVRFDATETATGASIPGAIEIECIDKVTLPCDKIDWLIERLTAIKVEQKL